MELEGFWMPESTDQPNMLSDENTPVDDDMNFAMRWILFEDGSVSKYRTPRHNIMIPSLPNLPLMPYQSLALLFSMIHNLIKV